MKHEQFFELLSVYVDGELDAAERERTEAHVVECSVCAARIRELRAMRQFIQSAASVELSTQFFPRLMRALRGEEDPVKLWSGAELLARRLVVGLAFVVVIVVGVGSFVQAEEPIVFEPYLAGEQSDSLSAQVLMSREEISKDDLLLAVVSR